MKHLLPLAALLCTIIATPPLSWAQPAPSGPWRGAIEVQGQTLDIQVAFDAADDSLRATIDIPQQGAQDQPLTDVRYDAPHVHFELPAGPRLAVFDGAFQSDSTITGDFTQGNVQGRFHLQPGQLSAQNRPQEPEKPYPYRSEDVTFRNEADDLTLAGTLTRPRGDGPFPAAVLISGSGPQDRDETIFGHRPFLVLADYLTRRGVAVLRFDERGVGQSTGSFAQATTRDFAHDVQAAVDYLTRQTAIDTSQIGLIGHSEGGLVAPMVANQSDDVAFVVLMAAPGLTGEDLLRLQARRIAEQSGASDEAIAQQQTEQKRLFAALKQAADSSEAARHVRSLLQERGAANVDQQVKQYTAPWFRRFLTYDPRPALRQLDVPVLVLAGANDLQVPPEENLPAISSALEAGNNADYTVKELSGLNHLFQPSETGLPAEYATIDQTLAPEVLEAIGDWMATHLNLEP